MAVFRGSTEMQIHCLSFWQPPFRLLDDIRREFSYGRSLREQIDRDRWPRDDAKLMQVMNSSGMEEGDTSGTGWQNDPRLNNIVKSKLCFLLQNLAGQSGGKDLPQICFLF